MTPPDRLGELLVRAGVLDAHQLKAALAHAARFGQRLTWAVLEKGFCDEETLTRSLSTRLNVPRAELSSLRAEPAAVAKLDGAFCAANGVFPLSLRDAGRTLLLAMADPSDLTAMDAVASRAKARVVPFIAGEGELAAALQRYYGRSAPRSADPRARQAVQRAGEGEFEIMNPSGRYAVATKPALDPARLALLAENQKKCAAIVRAVRELLEEKGYLP